MSPSGAEVLREIKSRIDEVDPAVARRAAEQRRGPGRRARDGRVRRRAHPGREARPQELSGVAHRGRGARPLAARDPLLPVGQPLGLGGAHADRRSRLRARRVDDRRHHAVEGPRLRGRDAAHADRRAARALLAPPAAARGRASRASRSCSTPRCCCSGPAASARRPRCISRPPASARSGSSTTTRSTSPTSSAR